MKKRQIIPLLAVLSFVIASCSTTTVKTEKNFESVALPDHSLVYLNYNSSISYDKEFKSRKVELKGEGFFSVVKGETPFIITTSQGEIKVLGTEFNVKSESDELEVEVETGVVEISAGKEMKKITKGNRGAYHRNRNGIKLGKADFKFRIWMHELKIEFKKIGKEVKWEGKKAGKEFRKAGKGSRKGFK